MSEVEVVPVDLQGEVGYIIKHTDSLKIESIWIYEDQQEAQDIADRFNEAVELAKYRPDPRDPEVQELIQDPSFLPVAYEDAKVLDLENSKLVYVTPEVPEAERQAYIERGIIDTEGRALGTDGTPTVNWPASEVVEKIERHPQRVSGLGRIGAAVEAVARQRMEQAKTGNTFS